MFVLSPQTKVFLRCGKPSTPSRWITSAFTETSARVQMGRDFNCHCERKAEVVHRAGIGGFPHPRSNLVIGGQASIGQWDGSQTTSFPPFGKISVRPIAITITRSRSCGRWHTGQAICFSAEYSRARSRVHAALVRGCRGGHRTIPRKKKTRTNSANNSGRGDRTGVQEGKKFRAPCMTTLLRACPSSQSADRRQVPGRRS